MAGSTTQERARLAAAVRHGHDPDAIEKTRRDLAEAKAEKAIAEAVALAPALTPARREELARLLGGCDA
jgi:hypothetical protein